MQRYVRRGSKGIALIDTSGYRDRLRYVFDVSDTEARPNSGNLNLWELRDEHMDAMTAMLERNFGVLSEGNIRGPLEAIATQLAVDYWNDNKRDILDILADSFLKEYDEFNIGVAFRNAAEVSITHSLLSRCGLDSDDYFEHEDFMSVFDFNTPRLPVPWVQRSAVSTSRFCGKSESRSETMSASISRKGAKNMELSYTQNGDYLIPTSS